MRITPGALPRGLHALNLSKNSISVIEGLRELTRLRVLDLRYNKILRIGHGMTPFALLHSLVISLLYVNQCSKNPPSRQIGSKRNNFSIPKNRFRCSKYQSMRPLKQ